MSATWDNSDMFIKECGICSETKYAINIPQNIYDTFLTLLKHIDTEWLLYLRYHREDIQDRAGVLTNVIFNVFEYHVPDQKVSGAHVEVLDTTIEHLEEGEDVGVIHAHQFTRSTPHFSGTDKSFVNSNNAFSLVINAEGEFQAVARERLECDRWLIKEAKVFVRFTENPDIIEVFEEKATTYTYVKKTYPPMGRTGGTDYSAKKAGSKAKSTSSIWDIDQSTKRPGLLNRVKVERVSVSNRRIKDCPKMDDPDTCEHESFYDCMYYWTECPKKTKVSKGTIESIIPSNIEKKEEDNKLLELLAPENKKKEDISVITTPST